ETVPKRGYRFVAPVRECRGTTVTSVPPTIGGGVSKRAAVVVGSAVLIVGLLVQATLRRLEPERVVPTTAPAHRQVTFTGKERAPTLSPDGRRIAYVSDEVPEKRLMVQELAGGAPLTVFSAPEVGHLRWSPDGSKLIVWARG